MKKIVIIFAFLLPLSSSFAQDRERKFSFEIDPATFIFKGYSANVSYKLNSHWAVGAAVFGLEFPNVLGKLAVKNLEEVTTLRLTVGATAYVHYYFSDRPSGWFVGVQSGFSNFKITDDRQPGGQTEYTSFLVMPRAGYKYYLKNSGFYLMPWAGLTYLGHPESTQTIENLNYELQSILPFGAVHIGFSF